MWVLFSGNGYEYEQVEGNMSGFLNSVIFLHTPKCQLIERARHNIILQCANTQMVLISTFQLDEIERRQGDDAGCRG
jgi:hypothetical protein